MDLFTEYEGGGILYVDGAIAVTFDGIESIAEALETDATEYPIERGGDVLDSAARRPLDVKFTGFVTSTPLTVDDETPRDRDRIAWDALRSIWRSGAPVTFSTAGDTWEDMRVVNITRDRTPQSGPHLLTVTVELRQITIADFETVEVPIEFIAPRVRPSASAEADAGRQGTQDPDKAQEDAGERRRSSILRRLLSSNENEGAND